MMYTLVFQDSGQEIPSTDKIVSIEWKRWCTSLSFYGKVFEDIEKSNLDHEMKDLDGIWIVAVATGPEHMNEYVDFGVANGEYVANKRRGQLTTLDLSSSFLIPLYQRKKQ